MESNFFDVSDISFDYPCPFCQTEIEMKLNQRSVTCPECGTIFLTSTVKENLTFQSTFIDEEENGNKPE